jgi:hypothetical protein
VCGAWAFVRLRRVRVMERGEGRSDPALALPAHSRLSVSAATTWPAFDVAGCVQASNEGACLGLGHARGGKGSASTLLQRTWA